jgi:hypothetical protein
LISILSPGIGIILILVLVNIFRSFKLSILALMGCIFGIGLEIFIFCIDPVNFQDDWERVLLSRVLVGFWSDLLG